MLFPSVVFLSLFLPSALLIYYGALRRHRKLQNIFLLLCSLLFYAWGEPWFVFVMIGSIIANWFFGFIVGKKKALGQSTKLTIVAMLIVNLAIIFIFKYLMFTLSNVNAIFGTTMPVPQIVLPIGISFFTFQAISYVLDINRGRGEAQKNPLNVGLYISFFPQLIAGPIVRYETIAKQIMGRKESWDDFSYGVNRFIIGLGKKVLLANNFAYLADKAFEYPQELSCSFAWLGAICYTLQIYYDFSGYSDMAIGLGRMFGFKFMENFNYPYIAKSTSEFWRRWHISLGTWFRDYVYFPLGGSRVNSRGRLIFNLFIVWLLTGIWHGANWTFILWGLLYFCTITIEKLIGFEAIGNNCKKEGFLPVINCTKYLYTMAIVVLGWVLFRAKTLSSAIFYYGKMFSFSLFADGLDKTAYFIGQQWVFLFLGIIFAWPVSKHIKENILDKYALNRGVSLFTSLIHWLGLFIIFILAVSCIVKGNYSPFIYFNF